VPYNIPDNARDDDDEPARSLTRRVKFVYIVYNIVGYTVGYINILLYRRIMILYNDGSIYHNIYINSDMRTAYNIAV